MKEKVWQIFWWLVCPFIVDLFFFGPALFGILQWSILVTWKLQYFSCVSTVKLLQSFCFQNILINSSLKCLVSTAKKNFFVKAVEQRRQNGSLHDTRRDVQWEQYCYNHCPNIWKMSQADLVYLEKWTNNQACEQTTLTSVKLAWMKILSFGRYENTGGISMELQ